jgi:hypothetical protein
MAQSSFQILFSNPLNETISDLLEEDNGNFLAVGTRGNYFEPHTYRGLIIKITPEGDTISKTYTIADTIFMFYKISQTSDNHYLIFGTIANPPEYNHGLLVAKLDSDLNMLWYKRYNFEGYDYLPKLLVREVNGEYYLVGSVMITSQNIWHPFFCRLTENGDTLHTCIYSDMNGGQRIYDFTFSHDNSRLWVFGTGFNNTPIGSRIVVDTCFNLLESQVLPEMVHANMNARWITDSTLLFLGHYTHYGSTPQDDDIGISETDTSFTTMNIHYLGAEDTLDYPAWGRALDFRDDDSIFYAGIHNVIIDFWPQGVSWITVGQLNRSLEPRYERYYGGDAYYITTNILSTTDGGCLISAHRYDYQTQYQERDILILKLNPDGLITNIISQQPIPVSNALLYPNPGKDILYVRTGLKNAIINISDVSGRQVLNTYLKQGITKIQCSNLSAGIYLYHILSENKMTDNGKWIKF